MTTATGDYQIDFKVLPDNEDYTNPDLTFLLDDAQIDSGLLNSVWAVTGRLVFFNAVDSFSVAKSCTVEKNSPSTAGGECGPGYYDEFGNGYELKAIYDELRFYRVTGGDSRAAIGAQANFDYEGASLITFDIDEENNFLAFVNGEAVPFDPVSDMTYPAANLRPGGYSDRESSGGGFNSGVFSFAASSEAVAPQIVNINGDNTVAPSVAGTAQIINMSPISLSIGSVLTTDFSLLTDTNYEFTMPFFVDGHTYPSFGVVQALAKESDEIEATLDVSLELPGDWYEMEVESLSSDPDSLFSAVEGLEIKVGNKLYAKSSEITLYSDTTFSGASSGTVVVWNRDGDNDLMTKINVVNGSVQPSGGNGFIEPIEFVGFIS